MRVIDFHDQTLTVFLNVHCMHFKGMSRGQNFPMLFVGQFRIFRNLFDIAVEFYGEQRGHAKCNRLRHLDILKTFTDCPVTV